MRKVVTAYINPDNVCLYRKIENDDKIVLVDTNYLTELSKYVKKENIVEIIDHHNRGGDLNESIKNRNISNSFR